MDKQQSKKELLLVTGSSSTQKTLAEQLRGFLPEDVEIVPYCVNEDDCNPLLSNTYYTVFSSREVFHKFENRGLCVYCKQYIIGTRMILNDKLSLILSLPRDQEVLLVTDSKETALEAVENLKNLGFNFPRLIPYYPGCEFPYIGNCNVVTTGDLACIPPGVDKVYNIGARPFDLATVIKIMVHFNILEEHISEYNQTYLDMILDFARQLSSAADEASKVMKTVRTTLIGRGYYAKYHFSDIIGDSSGIQKVKNAASKIAKTDLSVLIEGENGTGKELLASAIHNFSDRKNKPFIAINFTTLPDQLVESELFGYEDGAFTGAKKGGKIGLFQQAEGGTIFLDEIGDISLSMQTKLLRVLQEKEIMKVGGNRIIPIDVRIIAATNRNLKKMIEEGTFRKDLYYRLKEGFLYMPTLEQRREDIPLLIEHWMDKLFDSDKIISPSAMEVLMEKKWQGNIRELLNTMKFVLAVSEHDVITPEDFPSDGFDGEREETILYAGKELDELSGMFLYAIFTINHNGEIAGRSSILEWMKLHGVEISGYRVRKIITSLTQEGLAQTKEGRYGLTLTEKGRCELEKFRHKYKTIVDEKFIK